MVSGWASDWNGRMRTWIRLRLAPEVAEIALIRGAGTVPEEKPLYGLAALELVGEEEGVVLVVMLLQV